jgi:hypothetical protein
MPASRRVRRTGEAGCPRPECEGTVPYEAEYEPEAPDCPGGWSITVEPRCSAGCELTGRECEQVEWGVQAEEEGERLDALPRRRSGWRW